MKKILILGANPETARLVKKAKSLGMVAYVTDNLTNSPAKKVADYPYNIDGMDIDGICELVKKEKIDGVLVGTADPLVPTYHAVCKRLGFPCYITEKSVGVFSNKECLKSTCKEYGINGVPEYTIEQVLENDGVRYPIVIKPTDGRSGKGITVCYDNTEVEAAIENAKKYSTTKKILIERYMDCEDVFMYYTFYNGEVYLSAMADRYTTKEQSGYAPVVLGATYPSKYMKLYNDTLHEKMCKMFKGLGIENGILLMQAFVEDNQFYVYDPGFRFQGGAPHILIEAVNRLSQEEFMLKFAIGENQDASFIDNNDPMFSGKFVGSQVVLLKAGTIGKVEGLDNLKQCKEIISITQRLHVNDIVSIIGSEQQVFARMHIVAEDKADFIRINDYINKTLVVYDTNGKDMRLGGLHIG